MKKNLYYYLSIMLLAFAPALLLAQSPQKLQTAKNQLEKISLDKKMVKADFENAALAHFEEDPFTEISHYHYQQMHNGLEIFGGHAAVHLKGDEVYFSTQQMQADVAKKATAVNPAISAEQAIAATLDSRDLSTMGMITISAQNDVAQQTRMVAAGVAEGEMKAKLVYKPMKDNTLRLAWQTEVYEANQQHYWLSWIDAETSEVLEQRDLVIKCNFGGSAIATDANTHKHGASCTGHHLEIKAEDYTVAIPAATTTAFSAVQNYTYRVFDLPIEAPHQNGEVNPASPSLHTLVTTQGDLEASPYGWHSTDGAVDNTITVGNNVNSRNDLGPASPVGTVPDHPATTTGGSTNTFDYPADLSQGPETYTDAAIVNLFYWNNLMHDVYWHFGFDEKSGNFQTTNVINGEDRTGLGNDAVLAEAQDGEGTNNANMLTLADGTPPRMQMYLWSSSNIATLAFENTVNGVPSVTTYDGLEAAFGTNNRLDAVGVTGDVVLVEANTNAQCGTPSEGCSDCNGVGALPPNNTVTGQIVLIDRGSCAFIEKIMGAQTGGAAAVIVVNNQPGGPISMGGENGNGITIPAIMISQADGNTLKSNMALGTVNMTLKRATPADPLKDGDFDNGIIAHEYGHGISNRLTGGPNATGPLGGDEQGGEGWSDFFALYMTTTSYSSQLQDRGIGTYVIAETTAGGGIRPARYSTNLTVNPYTFGDIDKGEEVTIPHGVGFIWCTMLYEMMQNLIDKHGFNPDLYNSGVDANSGGNNIANRLIIEGLKIQPTAPTFEEQRDAILAADMALYGGENQCEIWAAFAKRGLGFSASSGTNSVGDETEAFDQPGTCLGLAATTTLDIRKNGVTVLENQSDITYTITVTNTGSENATSVVITDNVPENATFVSASDGGTASGGNGFAAGETVTFPPIGILAPGASESRTVTININHPNVTTLETFVDDMENGATNWTASPGVDQWAITTNDPARGVNAFFAPDPNNTSNQTLDMAAAVEIPADAELRFTHQYATEATFDAGVLEYSTNNGATYTDGGSLMTQNGYNDNVPAANNPLLGGDAFGGGSGGYIETIADLSSLAGENVIFRFRLSSDVLTDATGWWVDDVMIVNDPIFVSSDAQVTAANANTMTFTERTLLLRNALPVELTAFKATAQATDIRLDWTTETEINNQGFSIERRAENEETFQEIGFVNGRGTTNTTTNYDFIDADVQTNMNYYYRLKQMDFDGKFDYSAIRIAQLEGDIRPDVNFFPNPTTGKVNLVWTSVVPENFDVEIYDTNGRLVRAIAGTGAESIDLSDLSTQIYTVKIKTAEAVMTKRIVVNR